jgi:hypothetical protein
MMKTAAKKEMPTWLCGMLDFARNKSVIKNIMPETKRLFTKHIVMYFVPVIGILAC